VASTVAMTAAGHGGDLHFGAVIAGLAAVAAICCAGLGADLLSHGEAIAADHSRRVDDDHSDHGADFDDLGAYLEVWNFAFLGGFALLLASAAAGLAAAMTIGAFAGATLGAITGMVVALVIVRLEQVLLSRVR
jgi:hypothetical protein